MRSLFFAAVLFLSSLAPAAADVRILSSPGGEIRDYLALFELVRQSGERVVIDGPCFSACTLVLSALPRDRICVTRRAVFGFHAARVIDEFGREYPATASDVTGIVAAAYPASIRTWIERHGGLRSRPIFLSGKALAKLYPRCA